MEGSSSDSDCANHVDANGNGERSTPQNRNGLTIRKAHDGSEVDNIEANGNNHVTDSDGDDQENRDGDRKTNDTKTSFDTEDRRPKRTIPRGSTIEVKEVKAPNRRRDRFGNFINEEEDWRTNMTDEEKKEYKRTHDALLERDRGREMKWVKMLTNWDKWTRKKSDKIKSRIRKGIPAGLRHQIWQLLSRSSILREKAPSDLYEQLLDKEITEENDLQIRKDLPRCFQNNVLYVSPEAGSRTVMSQGQESLYNVLKAYSLYDPEVGYVQGMDSIAGLALMYMPEEDAFWLLVACLHRSLRYALSGLYTHGMPLAWKYLHVFDGLLKHCSPKLSAHLEEHNIMSLSFAFRWVTTRFAKFPSDLVHRIFDIFLNEGMKIIYRVGLWILLDNQKALLKMSDEQVMFFLQDAFKLPIMRDTDAVIDGALGVKITTKQINELGDAYDLTQATSQR